MPAETVVFASPTPAPKRRNHRRTRKPFDGRYVLGRRVRELIAIFKARIGVDADDPVTEAAVRRAAETVALSEDLRAKMLRGEEVSPDDVLRLTRAADALTRRLQLDRHKSQPMTPSLAEILREAGP